MHWMHLRKRRVMGALMQLSPARAHSGNALCCMGCWRYRSQTEIPLIHLARSSVWTAPNTIPSFSGTGEGAT